MTPEQIAELVLDGPPRRVVNTIAEEFKARRELNDRERAHVEERLHAITAIAKEMIDGTPAEVSAAAPCVLCGHDPTTAAPPKYGTPIIVRRCKSCEMMATIQDADRGMCSPCSAREGERAETMRGHHRDGALIIDDHAREQTPEQREKILRWYERLGRFFVRRTPPPVVAPTPKKLATPEVVWSLVKIDKDGTPIAGMMTACASAVIQNGADHAGAFLELYGRLGDVGAWQRIYSMTVIASAPGIPYRYDFPPVTISGSIRFGVAFEHGGNVSEVVPLSRTPHTESKGTPE